MPNIVVLGAGVSGLTVALELSKNKDNVVTIVAKHMPGDYDAEYTSPWAGANFMPFSDAANSRWERESWPEIARLATEVPEAGIHLQTALRLKGTGAPPSLGSVEVFSDNPWFASLFPKFRAVPAAELPEGIESGTEWTSVCINTALYLPWLVGQCRKNGVVLKRGVLSHISEAAGMSHTGERADVVVNCSGLMACRLGGVEDEKVKPVRGQIVLVRNELDAMIAMAGIESCEEWELTYTMARASGGGTILGGTYQLGNWDGEPDMDIARGIMERITKWHPDMKGKTVEDLDVVRHAVGLRPYREGGVRIEREKIGEVEVVHNYGHGGWGYQGSYGCAERVLELVDEVLSKGA